MKTNPLADLGEGVDANRVETALKTIGVALRDTNGEFRDLDDVFADLGEKWPKLTRNQKAYIATMSAGSRQQSRFMAIMNNYDRTLELIRVSTNSAGEAAKQYSIYEDSVAAAQNRMQNSLEKLYVEMTSSNAIKDFYNMASTGLNILADLNPIMLTTVGTLSLLIGKMISYTALAKIENTEGLLELNIRNEKIRSLFKHIFTKQLDNNVTKEGVADKVADNATEAAGIPIKKADTVVTIRQTAAKAAFNAVLLAGIAILAISVISIIAIVNAMEKEKQKVHELAAEKAKAAEEARQQTDNLAVQIDRYIELKNTLEKTEQQQSEYKDLIAEIANLYPDLVAGIDAEGNAILKTNQALKDKLALEQKDTIKAEKEANDQKIASIKGNTGEITDWKGDKKVTYSTATGTVGEKTVQGVKNLTDSLFNADKAISSVLDKGSEVSQLTGVIGQLTNDYLTQKITSEDYLKQVSDLEKQIKVKQSKYGFYDEETKKANEAKIAPYLEDVNKKAEDLVKQNEIELKELITASVNTLADEAINNMLIEGKTVTDAERVVIENFSKDAVDNAAAWGEKTGFGIDKAITSQSQLIQDEYIAEFEKLQKLPGFTEALNQLMIDTANTKLDPTEIQKYIDDFWNTWEKYLSTGPTGQEVEKSITEDALMYSTSGQNVSYLTSLYGELNFDQTTGPTIDEYLNKYKIKLQTTFSTINGDLSNFIANGINNLTDKEKIVFLDKINEIFDQDMTTKWENIIANTDMSDALEVKKLEDDLAKDLQQRMGITYDEAREYASAFVTSQTLVEQTFLGEAQKVYTTLTDINDLMKKSTSGALTFEDVLKSISTYGAQSVDIDAYGNYYINQSELLAQHFQEEGDLVTSLTAAMEDLTDTQQNSTDLTAEESMAINEKIKVYQKLVTSILNVTSSERAMLDNQDLAQGFSSINEAISSLKNAGDIFEKLQSGSMSFLETIQAIGDDPSLFQAMTIENGAIKISQEGLLALAETKKREVIAYLRGEQQKLIAQKQSVDAYTNSQDSAKTATIASAKTQVEADQAVADSAAEQTSVYLENKQKEIDAAYELYRITVELARAQGKPLYMVGKPQIDTSATSSSSGATDIISELESKYQVSTPEEVSAILQKQIEAYTTAINGMNSLSPGDMLSAATGTSKDSGGGGEEFKSYLGDIDKYINFLQRIKEITSEISLLEAKRKLLSTGGKEDLELERQKGAELAKEQAQLEALLETRKMDRAELEKKMKLQDSGFVTFDDTGNLTVLWQQIKAYQINNELSEEWYNQLIDDIGAYNDLTDSIAENTASLTENQQAREDLYNELIEGATGTREEIYNALVEADQREIDETKEKYNKMKEFEDDYLSAVKKAIDDERSARDVANKEEDLAIKKRKLATLERDTSGMYAKQVEDLRKEIQSTEQSLRDEQVDKQYTLLQEQYQLQQEQRDLEISSLEEQMKLREENGLYWEEVDQLIQQGPNAMALVLSQTSEFAALDPIKQVIKGEEIQQATEGLYALYRAGSDQIGSGASVVTSIQTAAQQIANQIASAKADTPVPTPSYPGGGSSSGGSGGSSSGGGGLVTTYSLVPKTKNGVTNFWAQDSSGKDLVNLGTAYQALLKIMGVSSLQGMTADAINKTIKTYVGKKYSTRQIGKYAYKEGGLVNYTGLAQVDGTPGKPESFLDSSDTKLFASLRDELRDRDSRDTGSIGSNSIQFGDMQFYIENPTNASAAEIAKLVREEFIKTYSSRINTSIQRTR